MRNNGKAAVFAAMLACAALPSFAAPAPWYLWRSKLDGAEHCAQFSPGNGWERGRGPFRDLHCSEPVKNMPIETRSFPQKFDLDQQNVIPSRKSFTPGLN